MFPAVSESREHEAARAKERRLLAALLAVELPRDAINGAARADEWSEALDMVLASLREPARRATLARDGRLLLGDAPEAVRWGSPVICDRLVSLLERWPSEDLDPEGVRQLATLIVVVLGLSDSELGARLPKLPRLTSVATLAAAVPATLPELQEALIARAAPSADVSSRELMSLLAPSRAVMEAIAVHLRTHRSIDGEPLLRSICVALGMPRPAARNLFSYREKKSKREVK
jgi:hypothetical protein